MQFTRELMKIDDVRSLVLWVDGNENDDKDDRNKYVICSYYDPTQPFGQQWCWGHYFDDLASAYEYAKETKHYGRPNEHRIREIAETAISWMYENGHLGEYLEDRDIDLTQDEKEYFVIDEYDLGTTSIREACEGARWEDHPQSVDVYFYNRDEEEDCTQFDLYGEDKVTELEELWLDQCEELNAKENSVIFILIHDEIRD